MSSMLILPRRFRSSDAGAPCGPGRVAIGLLVVVCPLPAEWADGDGMNRQAGVCAVAQVGKGRNPRSRNRSMRGTAKIIISYRFIILFYYIVLRNEMK